MAYFLFSPVDFYHVFSERTFMDFALNGFFSIFPSGFLPCLFKREPWILPSMALHFALPYRIFSMSLQEGTQILPSMALYFHYLEDLHRVSSERTITDFCPQWSFIFILVDTVSPQKELSRVLSSVVFHFILNPQQFCLLKDPFYFIVVMRECVDS